MKFPTIHNGAKPKRSNGKLTFTYFDSFGEPLEDTKHELTPMEICQKVKDRMERFMLAGPGVRESEISRLERKWISAHGLSTLRQAWELLDAHGKMEMQMMLDENSHFGISDPAWAKRHKKDRHAIEGDNQVPL